MSILSGPPSLFDMTLCQFAIQQAETVIRKSITYEITAEKLTIMGVPLIRLYKKEILKLTNLSLVFFMICDITVCSSYFIIKERNVVCMFWENVKNTMSCIFYDLMWSCYRGEMSHLKVYVLNRSLKTEVWLKSSKYTS